MNFQVLSDCHLEFEYDVGKRFIDSFPVEDEYLIIAGDFIAIGRYPNEFADRIETLANKYKHVLYVAGNHEYYGSNSNTVNNLINVLDRNIPNFTFLNNSSIVLDGKKISGCTLWFQESSDSKKYEQYLGDFHRISDIHSFVYKECNKSMEFIRNNLDSDIIITHHMPSKNSTPAMYKDSIINCYFVCDMENDILNFKGKWVHGHTHTPIRYKMGDAEVICNPMGYPNENKFNYNTKCLVY